MTKLPRGSSFLQNPKSNSHNHLHLHDRTRSLTKNVVHEKRQDGASDSSVTEIVQTVELVQVVDSDGSPVEVQTILSPPTTRLVDPATGDIIDPSPIPPAPPVPTDVLVDVPDLPVDPIDAGGFVADSSPDVSSSLSEEPAPTELPVSNSSQDDDVLTSIPSSISSAFPTLASPFNGTNGFWNGSLFTNSSGLGQKTRKLTSITLPTTTETISETPVVVVVTATAESVPGDVVAAPLPPTEVDSGPDEPPPTSAVVGISVGSIAGAALLIFVVMALIRWKRRQTGREKLEDGPGSKQGLLTDGRPTGGMAQRSLPFDVPGVLASLSGYKQQPKIEASMEERGFYRVSGKKLPSVLEHGGDGYTDPRQSVMSATSSHYRDSQLFDAEQGRPPRLALGSPMRPISGVPIIRSGPARTPVTEDNPFSDPPTPSSSLHPDAIGRSLTGQDGSRVSSSRFTEEV